MKGLHIMLLVVLLSVSFALPAMSASDMATKLNNVLVQAPANKFWQVKASEVSAWMEEDKKDFLIIDVRPNPVEYSQGHIPGAIQIPVQNILKPESLKKLPKNKKLVLYCVTGQTQNLPIIALRALGYNAYTMAFGMTAWQKDYFGGKIMQGAIDAANYSIEK